jgi:hypothetical protein
MSLISSVSYCAIAGSQIKNILAYLLLENRHKRIRQPWGEVGAWFWASGQRLNETSCTDEFVWKISNDKQLPLSFTFWMQDEPNCFRNQLGLPVEGCLQIRPETDFKWNDVPCEIVLYPLCEYDPM